MSESVQLANGLSEVEAQARLKAEGYNELPGPLRRTPFRIVGEVLREPMLALLLGGGVVYLLLGDLQDALILLGFAALSVVSPAADFPIRSSYSVSVASPWHRTAEY